MEGKTETPLVGPSRCAEAYVSLGMGSTLCYSDIGAADDAFEPRQRFSRGFLNLGAESKYDFRELGAYLGKVG